MQAVVLLTRWRAPHPQREAVGGVVPQRAWRVLGEHRDGEPDRHGGRDDDAERVAPGARVRRVLPATMSYLKVVLLFQDRHALALATGTTGDGIAAAEQSRTSREELLRLTESMRLRSSFVVQHPCASYAKCHPSQQMAPSPPGRALPSFAPADRETNSKPPLRTRQLERPNGWPGRTSEPAPNQNVVELSALRDVSCSCQPSDCRCCAIYSQTM